jgi:hypothetical protein
MSYKIAGTKYQNMADEATQIYLESGFDKPHNNYDSRGYGYEKSDEIKFVFYWDCLDEILTPLGSINITFGSWIGDLLNVAKEKLIQHFGLELISERDGFKGEKWFYYKPTKNVPE